MRTSFFQRLIFRLSMLWIVSTALVTAITPMLSFNTLLYPERIDSLYLRHEQMIYEKSLIAGKSENLHSFFFNPGELGAHYREIAYSLSDSTLLRGWLVTDSIEENRTLLVLLPDYRDGAIRYSEALVRFSERKLHACVMDLRAQGRSDGNFYQLGKPAAEDVTRLCLALRQIPFVDNIALMGIGTGAAIAIDAAKNQGTADVLVLQNAPVSLSSFFSQEARREWGFLGRIFQPSLIRNYEKKTGIHLHDYNYDEEVSVLQVPQLFIVGNNVENKTIRNTYTLLESSAYDRKKWYADTLSFGFPAGAGNSKLYYDRIAAFVNSSVPAREKKSKFRKLALTWF